MGFVWSCLPLAGTRSHSVPACTPLSARDWTGNDEYSPHTSTTTQKARHDATSGRRPSMSREEAETKGMLVA